MKRSESVVLMCLDKGFFTLADLKAKYRSL